MNNCACRDCFELVCAEPGSLCWGCEEAGCTPCTCTDPDRGCPHGACDRPEAYGCEENP